jgi:hypothetical protein
MTPYSRAEHGLSAGALRALRSLLVLSRAITASLLLVCALVKIRSASTGVVFFVLAGAPSFE